MRLETFDRKNPDHVGAAKAGKHVMFLADGGVMKLGALSYNPEGNSSRFHCLVKYYNESSIDSNCVDTVMVIFLDASEDCDCGLCEER